MSVEKERMQQHDERMQEKSAASALAVALLIALLVGSLLLVLSLVRRSSEGTPGNTLHPSKLAGGSGTLISLHMIDPTTGWALSEHAVLRTADGGFHWKNVTPPNTLLTRESIADFLTANLAWVTTPQANGATMQVLRTMDSGQTWQQSTIPAAYVKQMTFVDAQRGWILTGWGAGGGAAEAVAVYRTGDGGKTWRKVSSALPASTDTPPWSPSIRRAEIWDPFSEYVYGMDHWHRRGE